MASQKKIEYVIFDMDGLMIDSERVYTDVTNDILAQYGATMTWEIKAGLMGKPERAASAHLLSFFPNIPLTIDDYIAQRRVLQDARWPHVQLLPGVERLVAHLAAHDIPIAIATGSMRRNYELKTAHLQHVFARFGSGHVVCGDDGAAGRGKPFPDVFLAAARTLGRAVGPNEEVKVVTEAERDERARGLVFEDAILGVQSGKRAGMNVVWIPDENLLGVGPSQITERPDRVLHSLEDFVPEDWGLPPFDNTPKNRSE
ncbi:HAD-like domain-containing protein [Multifurca ochricompacta]|uniref:HAD-like domain-containing protein n=1 Tax=Multifurca ochricompacta TaxID=376703 RepID=A0AAD4QIL6_9AGAM|nr:HAD-like domain-containing protein [Multifurca ochricompacta]